jgi:NAD(P)-dependent dehydrogenase (short-subunit alcohol dehydrogenase family)
MEQKSNKRVWLITGCSSGFGRELVMQLVAKGEQVVATARRLESLNYIESPQVLKLVLDVTKPSEIEQVVQTVIAQFGSIDVLINNAGYGQGGALEEVSDAAIREQFETNFYGVVNMTKAVLPHMRKQQRGHIQVLSSIAGLVASGGFGIYNASKFALEGMCEALAAEVAHHGIKVTLVEPGPFRTEFLGGSIRIAPQTPAYTEGAAAISRKYIDSNAGKQAGDPAKAAQYMIEIADMASPPLRLLLGKSAIARYQTKLNNELQNLETIRHMAEGADFAE